MVRNMGGKTRQRMGPQDANEERDACVAAVMEGAQRHQLKLDEVLKRLRSAREQADEFQRKRHSTSKRD